MRLAALFVPLLLVVVDPARAADHGCLIEPRQVLKLAAPVQGVIASVTADRGDRVHKGQLLARLDSELEETALLIAKVRAGNDTAVRSGRARVEFLTRKQQRQEQLRTTDATSFAQMDEAKADARVAEAQLREAELNLALAQLEAVRAESLLKQRSILSPVDGVVTERILGPGEYLNDQKHIMTVAELDPLRVEAFLPIALYGRVNVGDRLEVLPEAPVGGAYIATVIAVDHVLDAASSTIGIGLDLPNAGMRLPGGIHCQLRLPNG